PSVNMILSIESNRNGSGGQWRSLLNVPVGRSAWRQERGNKYVGAEDNTHNESTYRVALLSSTRCRVFYQVFFQPLVAVRARRRRSSRAARISSSISSRDIPLRLAASACPWSSSRA